MAKSQFPPEDERRPLPEVPGAPLAGAEQEAVKESERVPFETSIEESLQEKEAPATGPIPVAPSAALAPVAAKSPQYQRIELILEESLGDLYFQMDEAHRKMFRAEGEKTVREIDWLVSSAKATVSKVLYLIRRWLMLIPGVNKFFLEQEAKIKTDKVMKIVNEKSQ